jgi:AraC-like DNA-binding protein
MHEQLTALRSLVRRHARGARTQTAIPGLALLQAIAPTPPMSGLFEPRICVVLQGAKRVTIGAESLRYDAASYFIASVAIPASGCVSEASPGVPYLAISTPVDRAIVASLLSELPPRPQTPTRGFGVNAVTPALLVSLARLLALLDAPEDIAVLAPALQRELLYRLIQNDHDGQLRQIAQEDSRLSRVHRAIGWIRSHYDAPLSIDHLAGVAGMSRASFHRHFKTATAMSPLQYQKTLRLQEARRFLLERGNAQLSAHLVGYESASQFSRDYTRLFGLPPARDAARLRGESEAAAMQGNEL